MHAHDLPVGDPEHIRDLLIEHVAQAAEAAAPPPMDAGPIRCTLNGASVFIDPDTGHISTVEPDESLLDPGPITRWRLGSADGWQPASDDSQSSEILGARPDIPGAACADVSPDGRLLLLLCETEEGPRDYRDRPIGGVALWDSVAEQGWWLVHPVASVGELMGRLVDAHFYDDRYCVTENVDGATNGDVIFWDLAELPADGSDVTGWLGVIQAVLPAHRVVIGFSHTVYWPRAPNTPTVWRMEDGEMRALSFTECEADLGFALAPDGKSGCAMRWVIEEGDGDAPGRRYFAFTVLHDDEEHSWPLDADMRPDSACWAPDGSAVVVDMVTSAQIADEPPHEMPSPKPPPGEHRLVLIDATTGARRELARSSEPFAPSWLGTE